MKYRSDVDGLRALAVLPVVLFHAHIPGLSGGFIGVDIFFVISGYLICSLIARALARNEFSIIRFYENRCRRILPALTVMFLATSAVAAKVLLPPDMESFSRSLIAATFFVSNIFFWRSSSYFDGGSEFKPLLHTWSLGVEEQFYIFMPLILYVIARWLKSKYMIWLLVLTLPSFALSVWGLTHAPTSTFYLLPMRFWELAVGALIALRPERISPSPRAIREIVAGAGLLAILYGITMLSEESSFPGWNALLPCLGAAAIIDAGGRGGAWVSRLLSVRPLVFVGKISYSLYLWHWPLLALAKYQAMRQLTVVETAGVMTAALAISILSWRYVEMPFRQNRRFFNSRMIFAGSAAAMTLMTAAAFAGIYSQGLSFRYPNFEQQTISGKERYNGGTCFLDGNQTFRSWRGDDCFLSRGRGKTVLLWGDSYAAHYAPGLVDEAAHLSVDYLQYTASACPPVFDYYTAIRPHCREFNDNLPQIISKYGIKTVVMVGRWESLFKRGVSPSQVADTVARLNRMGVAVYVIGQSTVFNNDVQTLFAQGGNSATTAEASAPLSFSRDINGRLAAVLPAGTFIDPLAKLCHAQDCDFRRDGQYLVADIGHLSSFGSKLAVATYFPFVSR
ncbi:acyltransferase family protein [Caenimonas terrae]|uniref:Acyltransferase family protein n=1 Tax=Caenimonas terrae TaxID=696074 RepID=A0ABW0NL02_9BURK